MHEYDVALKRILTRPGSALLAALTGSARLRWLNVETPRVSNRRVDLLGETDAGHLVHIELQSRNERRFAFRMAEYLFGVGQRYGRLPRQVALYVGEAPMRMASSIEGKDISFRFQLVDIRMLDGEELLASECLGDNVISLLARAGGERKVLRRILQRIADGAPAEREGASVELFIVASLRRLETEVRREARKMPILNDIMDHEVFGPLIRQGRVEGQVDLLTELIEKRFGSVTGVVRKRISDMKPAQLKRIGLKLLDAQSIEDLFPRRK